MAYNPPRFMRERMQERRDRVLWIIKLALMGALTSCALVSPPGRVLYQQGRTVVLLEADPTIERQERNTHPAVIKPEQLAVTLRGIRIRSEPGIVESLLSLAPPAEAVFTEEELAMLAPVLADGLAQAGPSECVAFNLWSSVPGRRSSPLSGYVAVRDSYLRLGLNDHPTVGRQDPADQYAPKLFELEFLQPGYLLPGTEQERKGTYKMRPAIQIDYRRYLASLQHQTGPSVSGKEQPVTPLADTPLPSAPSGAPRRDTLPSDSEVVRDLQRQVRELTESNQELRAKLKELSERRDQSQAQSNASVEELARLRQELAETKQLLADKVLELNRLENKSAGTGR